jgi:hypothetical protein
LVNCYHTNTPLTTMHPPAWISAAAAAAQLTIEGGGGDFIGPCAFSIRKTFWSLTQYSSDRTNTFFKNTVSPNLQPALPSTQPPINRYCGPLPVVKRPGPELDHSLPSNAEVKNEWSCTSPPPIRLHGVDRDSFTFTYISPNGKSSGFHIQDVCGWNPKLAVLSFHIPSDKVSILPENMPRPLPCPP